MYEYNDIATATGILVFTIVLFCFLYAIQRTLSRDVWWLPYLTAIVTCICTNQILFFVFFW
ncbi:hypothetical protein CKA32_002118 [Geitlerinema sp. FC II]|nr:hypothetical protein CKA32_002118 [Geitlerinema sp. FC II]